MNFEMFTGEIEGIKTAFVVPAIPEDAPETVREGITRRRLASISGECPCGAQRPKLSRQQRRQAQRVGTLPINWMEIEHEDDCTAISDEVRNYLSSQTTDKIIDARPTTGTNDQYEAATAETRAMLRKSFPEAKNTKFEEDSWTSKLVDSLMDAPSCDHLNERPFQPAFASAHEKYWRCRPCVARNAEQGLERIQRGGSSGYSETEEGTCDRCRRYVGSELTLTVLRVDLWVVNVAACANCQELFKSEGGQFF